MYPYNSYCTGCNTPITDTNSHVHCALGNPNSQSSITLTTMPQAATQHSFVHTPLISRVSASLTPVRRMTAAEWQYHVARQAPIQTPQSPARQTPSQMQYHSIRQAPIQAPQSPARQTTPSQMQYHAARQAPIQAPQPPVIPTPTQIPLQAPPQAQQPTLQASTAHLQPPPPPPRSKPELPPKPQLQPNSELPTSSSAMKACVQSAFRGYQTSTSISSIVRPSNRLTDPTSPYFNVRNDLNKSPSVTNLQPRSQPAPRRIPSQQLLQSVSHPASTTAALYPPLPPLPSAAPLCPPPPPPLPSAAPLCPPPPLPSTIDLKTGSLPSLTTPQTITPNNSTNGSNAAQPDKSKNNAQPETKDIIKVQQDHQNILKEALELRRKKARLNDDSESDGE